MKTKIMAVMIGLALIATSAFAADGDLIVNGKLGVGTTAPAAKIDANGEIKIGNTGLACSSTTAGATRYNSGRLEYCNGTIWGPVSDNTIADGTITLNKLKLATGSWSVFGVNSGYEIHFALGNYSLSMTYPGYDYPQTVTISLVANSHIPTQSAAYNASYEQYFWSGSYTYHSNSEQIIVEARNKDGKIISIHVTEKGNENSISVPEGGTLTIKTIETNPELFTQPVYKTLYDKDGKEVKVEVEEGKMSKYNATQLMEILRKSK